MEICDCSARDIFEYSEEPLLEEEIALIAYESLKVCYILKKKILNLIEKKSNRDLNICMLITISTEILKQQIF